MSRIIAGSARGARLQTPPGERTRPTTDRVREALFSSLATWNGSAAEGAEAHLEGIAFCDLFAGSGAVGLEAASRGARRVVCVEKDQPTSRIIKANASKAKLGVEVECASVDAFLQRGTDLFDVIWLDPPYPFTNDQVAQTLALAMPRLVHNGLVVLERSRRSGVPALPEGTEHWQRDYGETVLHHVQWSDDPPSAQQEEKTDD